MIGGFQEQGRINRYHVAMAEKANAVHHARSFTGTLKGTALVEDWKGEKMREEIEDEGRQRKLRDNINGMLATVDAAEMEVRIKKQAASEGWKNERDRTSPDDPNVRIVRAIAHQNPDGLIDGLSVGIPDFNNLRNLVHNILGHGVTDERAREVEEKLNGYVLRRTIQAIGEAKRLAAKYNQPYYVVKQGKPDTVPLIYAVHAEVGSGELEVLARIEPEHGGG